VDEEQRILVRLKEIRLERLRDFRDVWLAWGLWRLLELDKLLVPDHSRGPRGDSLGYVCGLSFV